MFSNLPASCLTPPPVEVDGFCLFLDGSAGGCLFWDCWYEGVPVEEVFLGGNWGGWDSLSLFSHWLICDNTPEDVEDTFLGGKAGADFSLSLFSHWLICDLTPLDDNEVVVDDVVEGDLPERGGSVGGVDFTCSWCICDDCDENGVVVLVVRGGNCGDCLLCWIDGEEEVEEVDWVTGFVVFWGNWGGCFDDDCCWDDFNGDWEIWSSFDW